MGLLTLGTVTTTLLPELREDVRVTVAERPLAAHVPVAPVLEQDVPDNFSVEGNCTTIRLPDTRLFKTVKVTVHVARTLTELLLIATDDDVMTPALAVIALVAVSIKYMVPLEFVNVVTTMLADLMEVG